MSSPILSEWGPNWQGCVNRQLAEECLYKRTHSETVPEMKPRSIHDLFSQTTKRAEERMRERKKTGAGCRGVGVLVMRQQSGVKWKSTKQRQR